MSNEIPASVIADAQVYAALAAKFPELEMDRQSQTVFQFAAMPMSALWYTGNKDDECDWCEYVSVRRDGYFFNGTARFSQSYRTMLRSADRTCLGNECDQVDAALNKMSDNIEMHISGNLASDAEQWDQNTEWMFTCEADSNIPTDNSFLQSFEGSLGTVNPLDELLVDQCSYRLRVKGVGIYEIVRGDWYQESLVRPDFPLVQGGNISSEQLFGEQGGLQHTGLKLLVSYEPEMTITVSARQLPRLMARNALSMPVMIGGLHFDLARAAILSQANVLGAGPAPVCIRVPALSHTPQVWGVLSKCNYL